MLEQTPNSPNKKPFEKEREFHEERWKKKEMKDAARGPFRRYVDKNRPDRTADDFMREEADRDNADFKKRQHAEFQKWQEQLQPVVSGFKARAEHPGDTENTTMIRMMPGGMKGPYEAGQALALQMMGITPDIVDMVIGTSTGAVVATAFVAGPEATQKGTTMLLEELSSKKFINTARVWEIIKLRLINELWSDGEYKLDTDAVKKAHTQLLYTVTEPVKGDEEPKVKYLDAKTIQPGMIDGVISSMSIPYVTGEIPEVDSEKNYDGGFAGMDIEADIEEFKKRHGGKLPRNILILPAMPFETLENIKPSAFEERFAAFARKRAGSLIKTGSLDAAAQLHQLEKGLLLKYGQRKGFERLQKKLGVHIGVLWPPDSDLSMLTIDQDQMTEAVLSSARDTFKQFGEKQPNVIPLYKSKKQELKEVVAQFKQAA